MCEKHPSGNPISYLWWESKWVRMFLTWWFWCNIQMVQEWRYIAQSLWRRCFIIIARHMYVYIYIYIAIWLYRINYIDILKIQGTKSPKSRKMPKFLIGKKCMFFLLSYLKKKHFEQLTKGTPLNNVHVHPQLKNTLSSLTYQGKSVESKLISIDILIHFLNLKGKSPPLGGRLPLKREISTHWQAGWLLF